MVCPADADGSPSSAEKIVRSWFRRGLDWQAIKGARRGEISVALGRHRLNLIALSPLDDPPLWDADRQFTLLFTSTTTTLAGLRSETRVALGPVAALESAGVG